MTEEYISKEEYEKFRRAVVKKLKFLEGLIDDAFKQMTEVDDRVTGLTDEAIDRSSRAERAVRRLKKQVDELE